MPTGNKLKIRGGKPLKGKVKIAGSKNAVLPILCASLMCEGITTLSNVPNISDVTTMLELLEYLGAKVERVGEKVSVDARKIKNKRLPHEKVSRMRASILLLAPLLARFGKVEIDFPGGCVLGKRPTRAHEVVFEKMGVKNLSNKNRLKFIGTTKNADYVMQETSVTATENAIMVASLTAGQTTIRLSATEPHVEDLCNFLKKSGVKIEGIGTHTLRITGVPKLKPVKHTIRGDYLELGTWALISACTRGEIEIVGGEFHDLDAFWQKFEEIGVSYEVKNKSVIVRGAKNYKAIHKIETGVHPKFPTDLQAPFGVLLTQCKGRSRIFETLFEGRLGYLWELEKMGAGFEIVNSHEAIVFGVTKLKGAEVSSLDIRAGAAMVVAGLMARGETIINDVKYFYRGYEGFEEKLKALGASIEVM